MASRTIWRVITTVSIYALLEKRALSESLAGARRLSCALARCWPAGLLALAPPARAEAPATEITQLRLERSDEGVCCRPRSQFELPPVIDDALDKGIPMFFVAEAVLLSRPLVLVRQTGGRGGAPHAAVLPAADAPLAPGGLAHRRSAIRALALDQTFDTREEALAAVQRISHWKIAEAGEVDPDARYNVDFRFRLDVSQLPRPFQIGAVGQSDWNIAADAQPAPGRSRTRSEHDPRSPDARRRFPLRTFGARSAGRSPSARR